MKAPEGKGGYLFHRSLFFSRFLRMGTGREQETVSIFCKIVFCFRYILNNGIMMRP